VNPRSKTTAKEQAEKSFTLQFLPGGVASFAVSEYDMLAILPLHSDDAEKTLQLRTDGPVVYKNNRICLLNLAIVSDITKAANNEDNAEQEREKDRELLQKCQKALEVAGKTDKDAAAFGVVIHPTDEFLPVLKELKGSGAGVYFRERELGPASRAKVSKEFIRALSEVNPRRLMLNCQGFAALGGKLPAVESLCLAVMPGETIPDLSGLHNLRHVILVTKSKEVLDLKPIAAVTHLKALTVLADKCRNVDALGNLADLQFLTAAIDDPAILCRLPRLQHLNATFPVTTDFSFAQRMPYLQTLGILNMTEQHDVEPLAKLPRLQCLALSGGQSSFNEITGFRNVKDFQRTRPDVKVVEYEGVCLGSWWLLPLAIIAAMSAAIIRRLRRGQPQKAV